MIASAQQRATDADLAAIRQRLMSRLNDEGLRAWYPHDTALLLTEVMALRQIVALSLQACRANPALESDTDDLVTACKEILGRWLDLQTQAWQRAQTKKIRDRLSEVEAAEGALTLQLDGRDRELSNLRAQLDQAEAALVDAIADGERARLAVEKACRERATTALLALAQAQEALKR